MASYTSPTKTATPHHLKKVKFQQLQQQEPSHWSQGLLPPSIRSFIDEKCDYRQQLLYSLVTIIIQLIIEVSFSTFYLVILFIAHPDSVHFARTVGFSFLFVYSGTNYMRKFLIVSYFLIIIPSLIFLVFSTCVLIRIFSPAQISNLNYNNSHNSSSSDKLRSSYYSITQSWLIALTTYLTIKVITFIFQHTVNDLFFGYHRFTLTLWIFFIVIDVLILMIIYPNVHVTFDDTDKLDVQDQYERANTNDDEDVSLPGDADDSAESESTSKHPRSSTSDINVRPSPEASSISTSVFSYKSEKTFRIPITTSSMELRAPSASASTDLPPRCSTQTPV